MQPFLFHWLGKDEWRERQTKKEEHLVRLRTWRSFDNIEVAVGIKV